MAVDSAGNIWTTGRSLTGRICASYMDGGGGLFQTIYVYCHDAYVTELDSSGTKTLYSAYLTHDGDNGGMAITIDQAGSIYIAGYTTSAAFPVTPGAFQTQYGGGFLSILYTNTFPAGDVFVTKLNHDGTVVYSTYLGGSDTDVPVAIRVDKEGCVYVAGTSYSTNFPLTSNPLTKTPRSFVSKLNPSGAALIYSSLFYAPIAAVDFDSAGAIYLTGYTTGLSATTSGAAQASFGGVRDAFVSKIDPVSGRLVYSTYLGGLQADSASAMAVDTQGAAWIAGSTQSPDFPKAGNAGGAFLIKLAPDGSRIESATTFGSLGDGMMSLALDGLDNVYAYGSLTSANFSPTANAALSSSPSPPGGCVAVELSPGGTLLYGSYAPCTLTGVAWAMESPPHLVIDSYRGVVNVDFAPTSTLTFTYPVGAASFSLGAGLAPGEIVSIFGSALGPDSGAVAQPDASGRMPFSLSGVQVLFNGTPGPLLFAQSGQINAVVPVELVTTAPATVDVEVRYNGQSVTLPGIPVVPASPGIFAWPGDVGAIINQDGTLNSASNPARLGTIVSIYATGLGALNTGGLGDGEITPIPPPFFPLSPLPTVLFSGAPGNVVWAGSAPTLVLGVTQINAQLPGSFPPGVSPPAISVNVQSGGYTSPAVSINVAP